MNWSDLLMFLAVAQTGSLRKAAKTLGVAQPTVSRRLQRLEQNLGFPLFDRARNGLSLTPAGADLLPEVRAVESAVLRVEQRSISVTTQMTETVRVGAGETSAAVLARGLHLLRDGPMVELIISDDPLPFETRQPDILVRHGMPKSEAGLTRRVGSVGSAVYGMERFAQGRALPLSREDISTLPWIGFVAEQDHYITMAWLKDVMRDRPPATRLMNADLMAAAAIQGVGVAVLPSFKGDTTLGLVRLSQLIEPLRADYWTITQPGLARNLSVRAVMDWIVDCFRVIARNMDSSESDH